jgi:hypothetical protein
VVAVIRPMESMIYLLAGEHHGHCAVVRLDDSLHRRCDGAETGLLVSSPEPAPSDYAPRATYLRSVA